MKSLQNNKFNILSQNVFKTQSRVTIIILNHNKKHDLFECLESIYRMDYKDFDIIVVDNGSIDESAETVSSYFPKVHLILNKSNLGVAGGRNSGIKYAFNNLNFDYILFLDNDIIMAERTLSEMVDSFNLNTNIGIVTPKCYSTINPKVIYYAGGINVNLYTGAINNIGNKKKDKGQYDKIKFIPSCGGLCLVSKKLINEIGLFDERFNPYGWEDVDFSLRAKKNNFRIIYNYKAIIYHKGGKKGRGFKTLEYESAKIKNYFYLLRKHANIFQLFIIALLLPLRIFSLIIKELIKTDHFTIYSQFSGLINYLGIYRKQNNA